MRQTYAYFGDGHPAEEIACGTCKAAPQTPCTITAAIVGTGVSVGMLSRGMHAERIAAVNEQLPPKEITR